MIRLHRFPFSTNVERVTLALEHKRLAYESVWIDPSDRSEVVRLSGQELVPIAEIHGEVVTDSMRIVARLEELHPDPPLYPREAARRAEVEVFVDWFNRVWKVSPNAIADELGSGSPDVAEIAACEAEMAAALEIFEALLDGRPYLMGAALGAADVCAFPFLKYALINDPADTETFHLVLRDRQPLGEEHPRLAEWIWRVQGLALRESLRSMFTATDWAAAFDPDMPPGLRELFQEGIEAFRDGDVERLLGRTHPDIEIRQPPEVPGARTYRGNAGFVEALADWPREWDDLVVEPKRVFAADDGIVVFTEQRGKGRGSGVEVAADITFVFRYRDDLLYRWEMYMGHEVP